MNENQFDSGAKLEIIKASEIKPKEVKRLRNLSVRCSQTADGLQPIAKRNLKRRASRNQPARSPRKKPEFNP